MEKPSAARDRQDPSYSEPWYKAVQGLEVNGNDGYANSGAVIGFRPLRLPNTESEKV